MKQPITNKDLKRRIIEISYKLKLSHIGSCLTAVDIIKEIYDIKKPDEKFVLSAGHAHLAHLVVRQTRGAKVENIKTGETAPFTEFMLNNYGIHCDRQAGCDVSTGSLGQGLPIAVGMALADRSKNVYCLISDGECAEGSIWEAVRIGQQYELHNLKLYLNYNGWAAYQPTHDYYRPPNTYEWETNVDYLPFLKGQDAHYHVMNEEEYKQALKILA